MISFQQCTPSWHPEKLHLLYESALAPPTHARYDLDDRSTRNRNGLRDVCSQHTRDLHRLSHPGGAAHALAKF